LSFNPGRVTLATSAVLGGRKVLGRTVKKADDLAELVREGLPATSITVLAERLDIGNSVYLRNLASPNAR
jgi:hypothetical protein